MESRDILYRRPPEILYHYTTQRGLLGIVTGKEIWASHTQYLNDMREFQHAIEIVKDELIAMKLDAQYQDKTDLLCEMEDTVKLVSGTLNVCVCSFSTNGDDLAQWRAYGGGTSGFSIGFSGEFLRTISDELNFWLVPVLYEEGEQRALVRTLLGDVLRENTQRRAKSNPEDKFLPSAGNLGAYLNRYAPILKHKSFSEEREWRIISRPLMCMNERFGYREGGSMLVPYFRIPLSSDRQPFSITEIVVGPTPHPAESTNSVNGLLIRNDLDQTKVRNSEVPYRSW